MKRIGIGCAVVVALVLATVLVAPSFVDWTEYREAFANRLAAATGRSVTIEGEVTLALLPRPSIRVGGVRIGNVPSATDSDFARADAVAVNLAFGPLLTGRLQFTSIEVMRPVINAEVLADGRQTWSMTAQADDTPSVSQESFDLGIDSLTLVDGTLRYRDLAAGMDYSVTGLGADLRAETATGPFTVSGGATLFDIPWTFDASVSAMRPGRPSSVQLAMAAPDAGVAAEFSGQLDFAHGAPTGSGRISISGESGAAPLRKFGLVSLEASVAKPLLRSYELKARVELKGSSIAATAVELEVGGATAKGTGSLSWNSEPRFDLALKLGRLDLNSWLQGMSVAPVQFAGIENTFGISKAAAQSNSAKAKFVLPSGISGALDLRIDLIEWRGQVMRNARLSATLANAELTIADAGLELPGNARVSVNGFVRENAGQPVLDLNAAASSRNLRGFLNWLGAEPAADLVPPGRLNALSAAFGISGTPEHLSFSDLDITLDTTRLTGSGSYVSGSPAQLGVALSISNLDLDSYVPALRGRFSDKKGNSEATSKSQDTASSATSPASNPLAVVNAQIKISVGSLTAVGNVLSGVEIQAETNDGVLKLAKLGINDFAGAQVLLSGNVHNVASEPHLENFTVTFSAEDFSRTSRALALNMPLLPLLAGPVSLEAALSGSLESVSVDARGRLNDLTIAVRGSTSLTGIMPRVDLMTTFRHPSYPRFMAALGAVLPESANPLGAIEVEAGVVGDASAFTLNDIKIQIDDNAMTGALAVNLQSERTKLTGTIAIARFDMDRVFSPDPTDQLMRASRARSTQGSNVISGRWSSDLIDLSALSAVDAEVEVTAQQLIGRGAVLEQLSAPVRLSNGVITVVEWRAQIYGGPATGDITVVLGPPIDIQSRIDIKNMRVDRLGGSLSSPSAASGKASLQGVFVSAGSSQLDLVTALSGQGTFNASGLDANRAGQGTFVSALLTPVRALSQLGGLLSGGVTKGFASIGAAFSGTEGVFVLSDATIKSNVYSGEFGGTIDLPRWWIAADGRVRIEANVITQLLGNRLQMPSLIPIHVNGPLDAPNVKMETNGPGAVQEPSALPDEEIAPSDIAPQPPRPPNPVDLFKGILNELTKPQ